MSAALIIALSALYALVGLFCWVAITYESVSVEDDDGGGLFEAGLLGLLYGLLWPIFVAGLLLIGPPYLMGLAMRTLRRKDEEWTNE